MIKRVAGVPHQHM